MTFATTEFQGKAVQPESEQRYAMILDPVKMGQTGYVVATLTDGRAIEYTDFVPEDALRNIDSQNPLAKLAEIRPAAFVSESDIQARDYSHRTDIEPMSDQTRRVVTVLKENARVTKNTLSSRVA